MLLIMSFGSQPATRTDSVCPASSRSEHFRYEPGILFRRAISQKKISCPSFLCYIKATKTDHGQFIRFQRRGPHEG